MYYPLLGDDYMKALVLQEPVVLRDKRLEVEWLAKGKYPVLIGGNYDNLLEFKKLGAPIAANKTKEGSYIGPGSGVIEMAPKPSHPNAARLYIDFILSREGQQLIANLTNTPVRPDVSPNPPRLVLGPDGKKLKFLAGFQILG